MQTAYSSLSIPEPTIIDELNFIAEKYDNPVQKIAHRATLEISALHKRIHELENASYLTLAHNICSDLGVPPGDINTRLVKAAEAIKNPLKLNSTNIPEKFGYGEDSDGWYVEVHDNQIFCGLTEDKAKRITDYINLI